MRRGTAVFVLVLTVLVGACGDEPSGAERALSKGTDALKDVRSGTLRLKVAAATAEQPDREVGFEVEGPFALAEEEGALPEVRFEVADLLGAQGRTATFASDGRRATVTRDGHTAVVQESDVRHLQGRAEAADGLVRLHVDEWARSPRMASDGKVVAEVDVPTALNDILAVAADVGAEPQKVGRIEGDDAERVRRAVRSSRLEVLVDEATDVMRQVRMLVTFGAKDDLGRVLGRLAGVRLAFELDLDHVKVDRDQ